MDKATLANSAGTAIIAAPFPKSPANCRHSKRRVSPRVWISRKLRERRGIAFRQNMITVQWLKRLPKACFNGSDLMQIE
jgi:hypothetical protein